MIKKLRLASKSPRRRELIKYLGYEFECVSADTEEIAHSLSPNEAACEISREKAVASLESMPLGEGEVIIGADTTVVIGATTLGKPTDRNDAFRMISMLSGKCHSVFTGVTLIYLENKKPTIKSFAVETKVYVDNLTDKDINEYLDIDEYRDKAGSYAIQGPFSKHIEKIEGDYNNVVGFPVEAVNKALKLISL